MDYSIEKGLYNVKYLETLFSKDAEVIEEFEEEAATLNSVGCLASCKSVANTSTMRVNCCKWHKLSNSIHSTENFHSDRKLRWGRWTSYHWDDTPWVCMHILKISANWGVLGSMPKYPCNLPWGSPTSYPHTDKDTTLHHNWSTRGPPLGSSWSNPSMIYVPLCSPSIFTNASSWDHKPNPFWFASITCQPQPSMELYHKGARNTIPWRHWLEWYITLQSPTDDWLLVI